MVAWTDAQVAHPDRLPVVALAERLPLGVLVVVVALALVTALRIDPLFFRAVLV